MPSSVGSEICLLNASLIKRTSKHQTYLHLGSWYLHLLLQFPEYRGSLIIVALFDAFIIVFSVPNPMSAF